MDAGLLHRMSGNGALELEAPRYERDAQRFVDNELARATPGSRFALPFYGDSEVVQIHDLHSRSAHIRSWWIRNAAGQTFRIKRISRAKRLPWVASQKSADAQTGTRTLRIPSALVLKVLDFKLAREYYESILGLAITRETRTAVTFANWLVLEPADPHTQDTQSRLPVSDLPLTVTLYASEAQFREVQQRLSDGGLRLQIDEKTPQQLLRTIDPDGVQIEVRLVS
jgi:extradiol dioxygenase family protein